MQTENACSIQTLIRCENHIPTCQKFAHETWEEEFFSEVGPLSNSLVEEGLDSESDDVHVVEIFKEGNSALKSLILKQSNLWMRLSLSLKRMAIQLRQPMLVN